MVRPNLKRLNFWEKHERRVLQVLTIALRLLARERDSADRGESDQSKAVLLRFSVAIRQLHEQGVDLISFPFYEANNQPDVQDEERAARENKRPDFQFG